MKANQKNKQPDKRTRKRKRETLEERVRRHLTDINSEITDDDIRSVRTELEIRGETSPASQPIPNEENQPQEETSDKQKKENETGRKQTTPWDLLSEGYD